MKCYQCGFCCKGFLGIVPKTRDSNLSPDFLHELESTNGLEYVLSYIDNNSELMADPCKWLVEGLDGKCFCDVYEHRSSNCRDYPNGFCNIGKAYLAGKALKTGV